VYTYGLSVYEEVFCLIQISYQLYNKIIEYCRRELPYEACGALLGKYELDSIIVLDFLAIKNVSPFPIKQFEFDRSSLLQLLYPKQKTPWIGIFHSHPSTAAYPSVEDLKNLWQVPVYAIVSFAHPALPIIKSYEITSNQQKESYSIKEQTLNVITSLF
jgi:proteasome lid subunit RPN8/RPN11